MEREELVKALCEDAEWARANECETPITLGDDLAEAADRIANQSTHIAALQQEIEKLRGYVPRWIPVEERLPEIESWGSSKVVLGIVQNESGYPPPNPCFCVYLGNQQWTIRGRLATISHWIPIPPAPEEVEE